jgi:hypothetical protein
MMQAALPLILTGQRIAADKAKKLKVCESLIYLPLHVLFIASYY